MISTGDSGGKPLMHGDIALFGTDRGLELRCQRTGVTQLSVIELGPVVELAYHHGRGVLALGRHDGAIEFWEIATRRTMRFEHGFGVRALAFSADGDWLASADEDGTIIVWAVPAMLG